MLLDNETIIVIDIQASNQLEILTCIQETFDYMPNWIMGSSVHTSPTDARFYCFNLTTHVFSWYRQNDTYSDTMDEDEIVINDLADISHLLEFVYLNAEALRVSYTKPVVVDPPKKRKKKEESPIAEELEKMIKKMVHHDLYSDPYEEVMKIQPMDMPKANVFYKDYVAPYGGKSKPYEASPKVKLSKYPYWGYEDSAVTEKAKEYAKYSKQSQEEAYKKWQWGWDYMPSSSFYGKKSHYDY